MNKAYKFRLYPNAAQRILFAKKKSNHRSYTTNNQDGTVSIMDGHIRLPKAGFVKAKIHRQIPEGWKIKSATVSGTPTGKYYAFLNTIRRGFLR